MCKLRKPVRCQNFKWIFVRHTVRCIAANNAVFVKDDSTMSNTACSVKGSTAGN